ncbi:MAG: TadE/TadG family type IV pilus assembly protein, partial [Candidatus Promineifilaceae bacterium]
MKLLKRLNSSHNRGQALAEFAIIIIFLSMLMFFIVDMARVGWAWVTVQGAARAGARYASTGNASCQDPPSRIDCVIDAAFNYMDTLKLADDPEATWGSDNAYRIEIWGIDENGDGPIYHYPGAAGKPVVVRTYYWVPIITPFFKPIKENIPVFGQVTVTNELFDSMGGASAGVGLPPPAPPIPTAGPTSTFTPTPTNTPTITPTNTIEPTDTPPAPTCDTRFETFLIAGDAFVNVTGEPNTDVEIYDISEVPIFLGTGALMVDPGHECEGFVTVPVSPTLIAGNIISVVNTFDGSWDTDTVLSGSPTATPEPPTPTHTPTPTATPIVPYLMLEPSCSFAGDVIFKVEGHNWLDSAS